ncbi:hypothetical protein, partial [Negativicoccus succinicivorans]|uniref:hypothetical protein n=1 Tax=Negativicoccus succinicivorans TaxID=620903 RepID=UPI0029018F5E
DRQMTVSFLLQADGIQRTSSDVHISPYNRRQGIVGNGRIRSACDESSGRYSNANWLHLKCEKGKEKRGRSPSFF